MSRRANSRQRRECGSGNAGGGGLFTPALVTSATKRFWHDAQDPAATIITGAGCSLFVDKFGNGYDASQGTDSKRPTLITLAFNGRRSLAFNAAAQQELVFTHASKVNDFAGGTDVAYEWWFVLQLSTVGLTSVFAGVDSSASASTYALNLIGAVGPVWQYERRDGVGADTYRDQTGLVPAINTPYVMRCRYTGTNAAWRVNGVDLTTSGSSDVGAMALDRLIYGAFGNGGGAHNTHYTGYFAEDAAFTGQLSAADADGLERYFKSKWGVAY